MDYKAFVSSTFEDLRQHRAYVIESLRKAGFAIDPMEDWTATSDEPKCFSQDRLEGCDLRAGSRERQIAGARTVAASLWSVAGDSTADLMIRFYGHLLKDMPKDEALRAAQLEFIRSPIEVELEDGSKEERDFSAPYHWAAFQLIGDWQ